MIYPLMLTTERLILREFVENDWQETLRYQSNPDYLRFYPWTQRTEEEVREFVGVFLAQQAEQPRHRFQLALTLKADGRLIGSGGIRIQDAEGRQGNIGYEMDPHFWKRGLATEAAHELLRFGFDDLGLHRISGDCVADNTASARVMEKLGMQREAHLRQNTWFKGRWWDTRVYAILENEYHTAALTPLR